MPRHQRLRMSEDDPEAGTSTVRTSIEVDEEVWRQLRAKAVEEGKQVSEMLEAVLRDHFDIKTDEN